MDDEKEFFERVEPEIEFTEVRNTDNNLDVKIKNLRDDAMNIYALIISDPMKHGHAIDDKLPTVVLLGFRAAERLPLDGAGLHLDGQGRRAAALDPGPVHHGLESLVARRHRGHHGYAAALDPEAVLFDEPTTGLDPRTSATIARLIKETQAHLGVTSVVVTHDLNLARRVGDRVAYLENGTFRFVGTWNEADESGDPEFEKFLAGEEEVDYVE